MATLRVFDVSEYIAAGAVSKNMICKGIMQDGGSFCADEMPCGGVSFVLNAIHEFYNKDTKLVFCFDRPPEIKRELHVKVFPEMGGYKGNRPKKNHAIVPQRDLAEAVIRDCGFDVVYKDGYEADDCIASLVTALKSEYDKIIIHARDSDLFYLVCDNVTIEPVGKMGKYITLFNWEGAVNAKYDIQYNHITIHKLIFGEMGDNIPAISMNMADKINRYIPKAMYKRCGNNELLKCWVGAATNNDEKVMGTLQLIMPLDIPYDEIALYDTDFNQVAYEFYANAVGNKYYRRSDVLPYTKGEELLEQCIDEFNGR